MLKKRKTLIAFLALVMSVSGLYAQQAGQFTLGGRVGGALGFSESANFGNTLHTRYFQYHSRPSRDPELNFAFAIYGNYAITSRISLQAELNFMISQGYELFFPRPAGSTTVTSREVDVNYSSLDIPLLLRINFLDSPAMFGIQAGPHVSIPLGRLEVYADYMGYIARYDIATFATFGATAGLFGGLQAGPGRVIGDLRFIFDFTDLEVRSPAGGRETAMQRRALAFMIGYEISF